MKEHLVIVLFILSLYSISCDDSRKDYFTQKLDHFNAANNNTWQHFCFDRIAESFDVLRKQSMDPNGRMKIEQKFNVVPQWEEEEIVNTLDMNTLFFNLYSIVVQIVEESTGNVRNIQYNLDAIYIRDVDKRICNFFEGTLTYPDNVDALIAVQVNLYSDPNVETSRSYEDIVENYSKIINFIDGHDSSAFDNRMLSNLLWLWQTCSEFGFHITTDYGSSIFAVPVPLNFHLSICERVFNITMDEIESGIDRSLYQYGGKDRFNTTNVVFTNGDKDPWKALGMTEKVNFDESIVPILIEGVSHSADMKEVDPSDSPSLIAARYEILANIQSWIEGDSSTTRKTMGTTSHSFTSISSTLPSTSSFHSISPTTTSSSSFFNGSASLLAIFVILVPM